MFTIVLDTQGQITVQAGQSAAILSQRLTGQGVTVLNPVLHCAAVASGSFTAVNCNLGLDSGIVLTTGRAATSGSLVGVNGASALLASNDNGLPGDPQLQPLAGMTTLDACSLEFDIVPMGDTIRFDYVFSSEEYKNAVCGPYNDAFAFFISGPGITDTQNLALVPGTTIPVTINSINDGIPGATGTLANCTAMGPGAPFIAYYINNSTGTTLTHQGLTSVMQAIHNVTPCGTYHLKIAIADAGDPLYDSGVFLRAASLQATNYSMVALPTLPALSDATFCIKGCLPGQFKVQRSQPLPQSQTLLLFCSGSAVGGVDYQPLPDSVTIAPGDSFTLVTVNALATVASGSRTLGVSLLTPFSCGVGGGVIDSITMEIYDAPSVTVSPLDTGICQFAQVRLVASGNPFAVFSWTPATGLTNASVANPLASPESNIVYTVTAIIPGTTCPMQQATVAITVSPAPIVKPSTDTVICYEHPVTLSPVLITTGSYDFHWAGPLGYHTNSENAVIDSVTQATAGFYTLTVTADSNGCSVQAIAEVYLFIPDSPLIATGRELCTGDPMPVWNITGTNIRWYGNATDTGTISPPDIYTTRPASYQFFVTQTINQCESPREAVIMTVNNCCDGPLEIPNAFSPNNDGLNDYFEVRTDYGHYPVRLTIYNRWGQVVYEGAQTRWDGRCHGIACEVGTYYYELVLGCIRGAEIKRTGDITLIR